MKKTLFVIAILGFAVLHLPAPSGGGGISGGGSGSITPGSTNGIWGAITGSIGDQTDLQDEFGTKVNTNSPTIFDATLRASGNILMDSTYLYSGGLQSVDYVSRILYDSGGLSVMNWNTKALLGAWLSSGSFTSIGVMTASGGNVSYKTNAWTTSDLSTNAFGLWNSNGLGVVYCSLNVGGTITNILWGSGSGGSATNAFTTVVLTNRDIALGPITNSTTIFWPTNTAGLVKTNSYITSISTGNLNGMTNLLPGGVQFDTSHVLLGRSTGTFGGSGEELTIGNALDWINNGTGAMLYRSSSDWTNLSIGSSGQFLIVGPSSTPQWSSSLDTVNINQQTVTNSYGITNVWSGPTNSMPLNGGEWDYTMTANSAVTNFSSVVSSAICSGTLWLKNASGGNLTINVPASVATADGARTWTVTNGQFGVLTFDMKPSVRTNAAFANQF